MGVFRSNFLPTQSPTQKALMHQTTDGQVVIHQQNDVSGILRANHYQRSEQSLHHTSELMNHVARIDVIILKEWCRQRGIKGNWWR